MSRPLGDRLAPLLVLAVLASACAKPTTTTPPSATPAAPASTSPGASPSPTGVTPSASPARAGLPAFLAGVTTAGAVELLDPATGAVLHSVAVGAVGDEVSLTPDGASAYFQTAGACYGQVKRLTIATGATSGLVAGGLVAGGLPALSPDGTKLAYAHQPTANDANPTACQGADASPSAYWVAVRTLATGTEKRYPLPPAVVANGIPLPIAHLSWGADNRHLAVSIATGQDNEQAALLQVDTASDSFYAPATGGGLPVAAGRGFYYREGVFLPNGDLFANVVCCSGYPPSVTATTLVEVNAGTGAVVRQIAVGLTTKDHASLDADASGNWLLYLSGNDLEVSAGGAKPAILASGLVAADW